MHSWGGCPELAMRPHRLPKRDRVEGGTLRGKRKGMSAEQRLAEVEQIGACNDGPKAREDSLNDQLGALREHGQQQAREPEGVQGTQRRTHAVDTRQLGKPDVVAGDEAKSHDWKLL
eukprot:6462554-Amphidinium_carterae.1